MSDSPLVSIITPSFNQARFLEQTMRSVLDQDYANIEYLVVDGGSTDGSVDLIRKYARRLSWWVSEKDSGQAEAINKGLRRAKGEYVAWINSDDYYQSGAISNAVKAFTENPQTGMVFGDVQVVDQEERILNRLHYGDWGLIDLMSFKIIGQPGVFMRRNTLEKAGLLDQSYHFMLDHHLWIRMAQAGGMQYVPQLWASAHYHEDCKNLAQASSFGKDAWRIVQWMQTEHALAALFARNSRRIRAGAKRLDAFYLLDAKEYHKAFQAYWSAFWMRPATVLPEWYRMAYALFAPLGLQGLRARFLDKRRKKFNKAT